MKKWLLKSFVSMTAIAAALQFTACGDGKTTIEDEDDDDPVLSGKSSSSSGGKGSSSSVVSDLSDKLTDVNQDQLSETSNLSVPSNIKMNRLAPSVFQLTWEYSSSTANLSGFLVQRQGPTDNEWQDLGALAPTVTRLIIDGANNMDYSYRLAAFHGEARSAYSSEVLVSRGTAYQADLKFPTVPQVVANIDRDSTLELVLTGNYPSQAVQYSVYNYDTAGNRSGELYYEARFVYGANYSVDTIQFSLDQGIVAKSFKSIGDECNSFGQVRVVWMDKNGSKDYGDWTTPIGTKTGTTTGLSGDVKSLCSDVVVTESGFAVPANLKADNAAGVWMLEWTYDEISDHPAEGFAIQRLDMTKSVWTDVGQTGKGVLRYKVGMPAESYNYYRVAAIDKDKKRSAYSGDVLITVTNAENVLGTPKIVGATEYSKSQMTLAWTYEENSKRLIKGFRIEELNLKTNEWTSVKSVGAEIRKFLISVSSSNRFFRVVAFDDNGSVASADFEIPANAKSAYALAAPEVGAVTNLSDSTMGLSWKYTDNEMRPAAGFVIQSLDLAKGAWGDTKAVSKSVTVYKVNVAVDARYMRVGAYEGGDTVYSATEWFIPGKAAQAATEALLATPVMKEAVLSGDQVSLSWTYANSTARLAKNIDLQIFKDNAWTKVATVGLNTSRYMVETADYERFYRVVAYDSKDSSYSNDVKVEKKSVAQQATTSLAAPVLSGVVSVSAETQALTWTYSATANATGFIVQALVKNADGEYEWTEKAVSNKDARRYIIEVSEENQFWRVAAYDTYDTVYSNDYLVPAVVYELAAPSNVKATVQKDNSVILSWSYKNNAKKPATGFRIEVIDHAKKAWTSLVNDIPAEVTVQQIPAEVTDRYVRVVAYVEEDAKITAEAASEVVTIAATASANEILPAPAGLEATLLASGKVKLAWTYAANADRPAKEFVIMKSKDAMKWDSLTVADSTVHTVTVAGPVEADGGLYYRVAAVDTSKARSYSTAKFVEYEDVVVDLPAPVMSTPEKLSNGYYTLSWTYTQAKKRPAVSFKLYNFNSANGNWVPVEPDATVDVNARSVTVKPDENKDVFYRIAAVDEDGKESYSNEVKVSALSSSEQIFPAPTGVTATMLASGSVRVSWTYEANKKRPAGKFIVQKSADGSTWNASDDKSIDDVNARNAIVVAPTEGHGLFYRVAAIELDETKKEKARSVSATVFIEYKKVTADLAVPVMSTPVVLSDGYYSLSWAYANSADHPAVNFKLYKFEGSDWTPQGSELPLTTLSKVVKADGKDSYYRISAIDKNNVEVFSNQVKVEAYSDAAVTLPAPVGVTVTILTDGALVSWSYTADSKNPATKFGVQSSKTAEDNDWGTDKKTVSASVTQVKVAAPTKSEKGLFYRVVAYYGDDGKAYSPVVYKAYEDVVGDLNAPVLASPTQLADGKNYSLSWTYTQSKTHQATAFVLEKLENTTWKNAIGTDEELSVDVRRVTVAAPAEGEVYYRVVAIDGEGGKMPSNDVLVSAIEQTENALPAPTGITARLLSEGKVEVTWNYSENSKRPAKKFRVESSENATAEETWTDEGVVDASARLAIAKNKLTSGAKYYRVVAIDKDSKESYSTAQYVQYEEVVEDLKAPTMASPEKLSNDKYNLSWTDNSTNSRPAKNFQVYKLVGGLWEKEGAQLSNVTFHYVVDATDDVEYYRVAAIGDKGADDLAWSAEVKVAAKDPADMALNAPKGVGAVLLSTKQVKVTWTYDNNENNSVKSFRIDMSKDAADWATITPVAVSDVKVRAVLVSKIPTMAEGGLFYRVVAVGASEEQVSDAAYVEYKDIDVDLPVPTGLQLTEVSSDDKTTKQYSLSWSYSALKAYPAKDFKIERLGSSGWEDEAANLGTKVLRYILTAESKDVYYRVVAIVTKDGEDVEIPSTDVKVEAYVEPTYDLPAPSNVTATLLKDGVRVDWNYTAEKNNLVKNFVVKVYNKTSKDWDEAVTVDSTVRSAVITEAGKIPTKDDGRKYYQVVAVNDDSDESASSAVMVEFVDLKGDLNVPTNLAYREISEEKVSISWSYVDNENRRADKIALQEFDGTEWKIVTGADGLDADVNRFEVDVKSYDRYFRVVVSDDDSKVYSADLLVPGKKEAKVFEAPSGLMYNITNGSYELSWTPYTQGSVPAVSLQIQKNAKGTNVKADWTEVVTLDVNVESYVLENAPEESGYYRIAAIGDDPDSIKYSNVIYISAYIIDLSLPAPTNLSAVRLAPSVWELKWEYAPEAKRPETGFRVQKSDLAGGTWADIAQPKASVLFSNLNGADNLEKYFRVAAFDGKNCDGSDLTAEGCQFSEFTNAIQITEDIAYRSDLAFVVPELQITVDTTEKVEVGHAPITGDEFVHLTGAKAFVAVVTNQATKNIAKSEYTSSVEYELRWVINGNAETTVIDYKTTSSATEASKEINGHDNACHAAYVQVRVKWTDNNGEEDYSEWSDLKSISDVLACED